MRGRPAPALCPTEVPISRGAEPANRDFTMSSDVGRHLNAITRRPLIRLGM